MDGPIHLATLVSALAESAFGGLTRHNGEGPWAQVLSCGDEEFLLELHPWARGDGTLDESGTGSMYFERVVPVTAPRAGSIGWAWVRQGGLPTGAELEERVAPANGGPDPSL